MKKIAVLFVIALLSASCSSIKRAETPFTVDYRSEYYPAGSIEIQFDKALGGLKKETATVSYYPEEDAVCLDFRTEAVYFSQFWSREGRNAFIEALEQYNQDFEERALVKSRKTKKAYGKAQGYVVWKTMKILFAPAYGVSNYELGYAFNEGSPFFTVMQRSAEYKDDKSNIRKSVKVLSYFTRAQAEDLAGLFNQEYLNSIERINPQGGRRDILRDLFNAK